MAEMLYFIINWRSSLFARSQHNGEIKLLLFMSLLNRINPVSCLEVFSLDFDSFRSSAFDLEIIFDSIL